MFSSYPKTHLMHDTVTLFRVVRYSFGKITIVPSNLHI